MTLNNKNNMVLEISELNKTYNNGVQALNNLSIKIKPGMFGLLGPNGAGKSTLMRTLATMQAADSGEVFLGDIDVLNQKHKLRQLLGYLPQEFGVYPWMTAEGFLNHLARLKGLDQSSERKETVDDLLQKVNLYEKKNKKLKTFSGGMKQRFGIAQALLGNPKLIIVDEPTAGLDPSERNRFHNLLNEIAEEIIVILSTHIVEDVKDICDQMAIINQGTILQQGNPTALVSELSGKIWSKTVDKSDNNKIEKEYHVISSQLKEGKKLIRIYSNSEPASDFQEVTPSLEDLYFYTLNSHNKVLT